MFMLASTMDDLTQHRKKRLELLIASPPYNGDRMAFIGKAQLTKGRISQLLDPDEAFGERSAQALALRLGLHERWFEHGGIEARPLWPFALLTPDDVRKLSSKALEMVERQALSLLDLETTATVHKAQTDTVAPPKSEGFPGTQPKPEFMKAVSGKRSADPRTPRKTGNG
jgi:hypothetical protein